ncbi:MAG: HD domain-containing protein [Candidatus Omnitrophica bacterium]|nr:HD domain-containing protein [Candidatus Omnitrophota bacterium]
MGRFRTRTVFSILFLILLTSSSYLLFLFQISNDILKAEDVDKLRNIIMLSGLVITCLAIIAALFISSFLSRGITRPLSRIVEATKAVSKRNFDQHIKIRSCAEIEELAFNFNHMLKRLKSFRQEANRRSLNLGKIVRERTKELSYIYKIGREASSTLELNEVLDTIVKCTTEVLNLKICTVLLVEETAAERLRVLGARGINFKRIEKEAITRGQGISGWAWKNKEALLIKDIGQDSRFIGRKKERYYAGSLICVPLEAKGKIIGVINGNNKTNGESFKQGDLLLLREIAAESAIAIENALLYKNLKEIYVHTISALASALEAKDRYMRSHSENVTTCAVAIAEELGLSASQIEVIQQACQLHDLGKIGIHDYILNKKGRLSPEEWDEVKLHSLRGAQILQPIGFLGEVAELVKQHHERFDGKGYPHSLAGRDIRLGARIMSVADAFDAMVSERPYRKALSLSQATAELKANSGTQFDPDMVNVFLKVLQTRPDLAKKRELKKEG